AGRVVGAATSLPGMLGTAAAVAGGVIWPLRLAENLEQAEIAFTQFLGGADKARTFLSDLQKFSVATPFKFPELVDASRQLLAYGFAADRVLPMLTAIGNASSSVGAGSEGIQRITRALGQMQAKGRVLQEDLMQIQELGINPGELMLRGFQREGEAIRDMRHFQDLVTAGAIPARRAVRLFTEEIEREPRYAGMMAKQAKSFKGLRETIEDTFETGILTSWGKGMMNAVKPRLDELATWLQSNDPVVKRWQAGIESLGYSFADTLAGGIETVVRKGGQLFSSEEFLNAPTFFDKIKVAADQMGTELGVTGKDLDSFKKNAQSFATDMATIARAAAGVIQALQDVNEWWGKSGLGRSPMESGANAGIATREFFASVFERIGEAVSGKRKGSGGPPPPTFTPVTPGTPGASMSAGFWESAAAGGLTVPQTQAYLRQFGFDEATIASACGPIAAAGMAKGLGLAVNDADVIRMAGKYGWQAGPGMGGVPNFQKLLGGLGVQSEVVDRATALAAMAKGEPIAMSTLQHYFVGQGVDPTKGIHVGNSGTARAGGQEWMNLADIARLGRSDITFIRG
ncbi:MAG TPA: tape measure protein, partial [Chloroflexota bacterium]|nr:tape measure protein [Chloroflexota bacterium]